MTDIEKVGNLIHKSNKIIIITGAGVSVCGGIPDFRSHNGLYDIKLGKVKGKDMFDASLFKSADTTRLFYSFILDLKQTISNATVTKTHKFIQNLNTQGKLLRCYTQNIDDLDKRAGLTVGDKVTDKCIQVHGDLDIVYCTFCKMTVEFNDDIRARFSELNISCPTCQDKNLIRKQMGKRLHTVGCLRPNIVLYNEYHPKGEFIAKCEARDLRKKPDLLIVMGTSLKIVGLKRLIKSFSDQLHATNRKIVYINLTKPSAEYLDLFDYCLFGKADDVCERLGKILKSKVVTSDIRNKFKVVEKNVLSKSIVKDVAADEKPEIESENIVPGVKGIKQLPKSLNPQQSPSKIPIAKLSGSKPSPIKIKDSKSKIASNSVLKQAATN